MATSGLKLKCVISVPFASTNATANRFPEHSPCLLLVEQTNSPAPNSFHCLSQCCYAKLVGIFEQTAMFLKHHRDTLFTLWNQPANALVKKYLQSLSSLRKLISYWKKEVEMRWYRRSSKLQLWTIICYLLLLVRGRWYWEKDFLEDIWLEKNLDTPMSTG